MRMHVVGLSILVPILLLGLAQESVAFKNEVFFISCLQDGQIDTLVRKGQLTLQARCVAGDEVALILDANSPIADAQQGFLNLVDLPRNLGGPDDANDCDYHEAVTAISLAGEAIVTSHGGGIIGCLDVVPDCPCYVAGSVTTFDVPRLD